MGRGHDGTHAHMIVGRPDPRAGDAPVGHHDTVTVPVGPGDHRTPEQWLRSAFEDAPGLLRAAITVGWRFGLLLRLTRGRSPGAVLGWPIVASDAAAVRVEAASVLMTARLVLRLTAGTAVMTTDVRFTRWPARPVWALALPVHRRLVPYLLGRAARRPPP